MKVDFHVHTNRSVDAIPSPREVVRRARLAGLDAIAITDHNRFFPLVEARRLTREFGFLVIPGIEGGNIAVEKHRIGIGITSLAGTVRIEPILSSIRDAGGISIAPHPHARLGYNDYAHRVFDAVGALNGGKPDANSRICIASHVPEVAGSDAHSLPMLGTCWSEVNAEPSVDPILESVRRGKCRPKGSTIAPADMLRFYPPYIFHRILFHTGAACATACQVVRDILRVNVGQRAAEPGRYGYDRGDQISS